eukprot:TRINITY_DN761_c0_g1_i4.p1 TRINITY_DN761_c0_g1~~TRINITY_DN761_c0_g1_i4.p1  ORF type:complete len:1243 (-),score=321.18 TRINITY_DN761_c0_g1_i4:11-3739(-)
MEEVERESLHLFESIKIATKRRYKLLKTLPYTVKTSLLERIHKEEKWIKKINSYNFHLIQTLQSNKPNPQNPDKSLYTRSELTETTNLYSNISPYQTSDTIDNFDEPKENTSTTFTYSNELPDETDIQRDEFREIYSYSNDQTENDSQKVSDSVEKSSLDEKKMIYSADSSCTDSEDEGKNGLSSWDLQLFKFLKHKKENPDDKNYHSITQLADHFKNAAETLGRMIISESHLSQDEKKVKMLDVGGIAGGSKYKAHGLFFKYPIDVKIRDSSWLYGGNKANNILASKASNHDLKGYSYMMAADSTNIFNYPLFSLLDFQGFRLVVMTELPLSKEKKTICFGSSDAGFTMNWDEEIHKKIGEIATKLHLQEHQVTKHKIQTHLCGDIEIHKFQHENEELLYVLDTARIFPPEYSIDNNGSAIFYKLLRPEFVASFNIPLVSDALSGWMSDDLTHIMNKNLKDATFFLKDKVIEFSSKLNQNNQYLLKRLIKSSKLRIDDINPDQNYIADAIIEKFHENGINTRYLGLIIHCVANNTKEVEDSKNHTLHYLITLLLARCLKNSWKEKIREESNKERVHDTCLKYSLQFLNEGISIKQNSKSNFWEVIKKELLTSFGSVTQKDSLETIITNNLQFVLFKYLILYFVKICGIVLNKYTVISVQKDLVFEFAQADISRFVPILKIQPVLNYYSGLYFYQKANSIEQSLIQTRFNYFSTAGNKFLSIINIGFKETHKLCAKSLMEALKLNLKFSCDIYLIEDIFSQILQTSNLSDKKYFKYFVNFLLCLHLRTLKTTNKKNNDNENFFFDMINQIVEQGLKDKAYRKSSLLFKSLNLLQQSKILGFYFNIENNRWERSDYLINQEKLTKKLKKYKNTRYSFISRSHQMKASFSENKECQEDLINLIFSSKFWDISPNEKMTFFLNLFDLKSYIQVSKNIDQQKYQQYWDIILVSPITNTLFSNIETYHYLIQSSVKDPNFQEILIKPEYNKDTKNLVQSFFLKEFCEILKENDINLENIRDKDGNSFLHFWSETYCDLVSRSIEGIEKKIYFNVKQLTKIDMQFLNISECNLKTLQDFKSYYLQKEKYTLAITEPYPNEKLMKYLLETMNPNLKNNENSTSLHKACENNYSSLIETLLSRKANIESQQKDQQTPLSVASQKGHSSVVKILLSSKTNIESQQIDQFTPLHVASQNGHSSVVEILLENKANIESQTHDHKTPLYIARQYGHSMVVKLLESHCGLSKDNK